MLRVVLIVSLSINIFLFSSLAMYGTWLAFGWLLSDFLARYHLALCVDWHVWSRIIAFWRIMEKLSATSSSAAEVNSP